MIFAIGLALFIVGILTIWTDRRHSIVQLIEPMRKVDYPAVVAVYGGLVLMVISAIIFAWKFLP